MRSSRFQTPESQQVEPDTRPSTVKGRRGSSAPEEPRPLGRRSYSSLQAMLDDESTRNVA